MDPNTNIPNTPVPSEPIEPLANSEPQTPVSSGGTVKPLIIHPEPAAPVVALNDVPPMPPASPTVAPTSPSYATPPAAPAPPGIVSSSFDPAASAAPVVGTVNPGTPMAAASPAIPPSKRRRLKPLLIAATGLIVLLGGSAAAYYGVIVPNQPANVLKSAIINSLQQDQVSLTSALNYQSSGGSSSIPPLKLTIDSSRDTTAKTSDLTLGFSGYNVNLSLEARLINQNLYLKAGDLSSLAALLGKLSPSLASPANTIAGDLSNQWVEVDSSILQQAGLSCVLNTNLTINQADVNVLSAAYAKNSFIDIQKTSDTTVNGQAAEQFNVTLDDNKAAGFIGGLGDLSSVKSLNSCEPGAASALTKIKGDNQKDPMTIWVSKADKRVIKLSLTGDASGNLTNSSSKNTTQGTATFVTSLNYGNVSITAPANAESVLDLYNKLAPTISSLSSSGLNLSSLLSGFSGSSTSGQ